jgi:hypothetical protein
MRRGDNAQLARISFVDDLNEAPVAKAAAKVEKPAVAETVAPVAKKTPAKKATAKKEEK